MRAVSRLVSTLFSLKLFDDESRDTSKVGQAVSPAFPNELTMRELISSLMRFSGAVTMFAVEQVQNVVGAPTDTRAAIAKMTETLDSMSESLVSKIDKPKQTVHESMSKAQVEVVDRTFNAVNLNVPDELMQKTSASLSSAVTRSAANGAVVA